MIIEKTKFTVFLVRANLIPKCFASRGIITIPTVAQAKIKAVTAKRLIPWSKSSPPTI